jgi:hypothetical protein
MTNLATAQIDRFVRRIAGDLELASEKVQKKVAEMAVNPVTVLSFGTSLFRSVAEKEVLSWANEALAPKLVEAVNEQKSILVILDRYKESCYDRMRQVSCPTSSDPSSNFLDSCLCKAWGDMAQTISDVAQSYKDQLDS